MHRYESQKDGYVYFIGAGPGAVDLITVRGKSIIDTADCIVYAGSLVNPRLFDDSAAEIHDSSVLNLDEIIELINNTVKRGGVVARVHTGDPSLYGATKEQMVRLDALGIGYEVVPGVTSAFAASASLSAELTLPEVTQTVIITRKGGRTPVPEHEDLRLLASHGSTMMIYLSVGMISGVVSDLIEGGYSPETAVVVVQKASWPDEKIVHGTLADIADRVEHSQITKTAMICIGKVFAPEALVAESKLYDKHFSHGTRQAVVKS